MRKAIVILATSVAFLLSGQAFAVRQPVNMPLEGEIITKAETVNTISSGYQAYKSVPTTVSVGTKSLTVPVQAVRTVPVSRVSTALKSGLRANAGQLILQGTIAAAVAGVGWVMSDDNTKIQKKVSGTNPVSVDTSNGTYYWQYASSSAVGVTPLEACIKLGSNVSSNHDFAVSKSNGTRYSCTYKDVYNGKVGPFNIDLRGSSCPSGYAWSSVYDSCLSPDQKQDLLDSDWSILDGFVKGQDGVWQRDLSSEICKSLPNPEECYKGLVSDGTLTGPSTVTGSPTTTTSTSSTTNPDGTVTSPSTSTSTQSPTITITYGDTYFDYSPTTTTTTTTNNNGSTTTTTETEEGGVPDVPDSLAGINDPLGGLPGEIEGQGSSVSPLGYHSWFSMGGSCKEHSFDLPVIGVLTTNYCPIHEAYVRPFLAFMFALWTWHYCFQIWRESVTRVRAD